MGSDCTFPDHCLSSYFDVSILSLLQFYIFGVYFRHFSVCSESCLYDILKS